MYSLGNVTRNVIAMVLAGGKGERLGQITTNRPKPCVDFGGKYKIISFYAKRARGLMARYAAVKNIRDPQKLKKFDLDGYAFDARDSTASSWIFRRKVTE